MNAVNAFCCELCDLILAYDISLKELDRVVKRIRHEERKARFLLSGHKENSNEPNKEKQQTHHKPKRIHTGS